MVPYISSKIVILKDMEKFYQKDLVFIKCLINVL